jgi:hypothetical protein
MVKIGILLGFIMTAQLASAEVKKPLTTGETRLVIKVFLGFVNLRYRIIEYNQGNPVVSPVELCRKAGILEGTAAAANELMTHDHFNTRGESATKLYVLTRTVADALCGTGPQDLKRAERVLDEMPKLYAGIR